MTTAPFEPILASPGQQIMQSPANTALIGFESIATRRTKYLDIGLTLEYSRNPTAPISEVLGSLLAASIAHLETSNLSGPSKSLLRASALDFAAGYDRRYRARISLRFGLMFPFSDRVKGLSTRYLYP